MTGLNATTRIGSRTSAGRPIFSSIIQSGAHISETMAVGRHVNTSYIVIMRTH